MAKIDLNNFKVVKFGNVDIERNYINDILHAIVGRLNDLQTQIDQLIANGGNNGGDTNVSYVTVNPEPALPFSSQLVGEAGVVSITNAAPEVIVGIESGGIDTVKLADGSVTIPKIDATGTPDTTTFLRGDGAWAVADKTFTFTQSVASASWVVVHNLNKFPSVAVEDTGGNDIEGEIVYDDTNQLTLNFSAAFSGTAYLN